jgi:hypothetical protein
MFFVFKTILAILLYWLFQLDDIIYDDMKIKIWRKTKMIFRAALAQLESSK